MKKNLENLSPLGLPEKDSQWPVVNDKRLSTSPDVWEQSKDVHSYHSIQYTPGSSSQFDTAIYGNKKRNISERKK